MSSRSESHWWNLLYQELKSYYSSAWFRIWQFQTVAWKRYYISWLSGSFFQCDHRGFLKKGVKSYLMASMSNFFRVFTSIIYGWKWRNRIFLPTKTLSLLNCLQQLCLSPCCVTDTSRSLMAYCSKHCIQILSLSFFSLPCFFYFILLILYYIYPFRFSSGHSLQKRC